VAGAESLAAGTARRVLSAAGRRILHIDLAPVSQLSVAERAEVRQHELLLELPTR